MLALITEMRTLLASSSASIRESFASAFEELVQRNDEEGVIQFILKMGKEVEAAAPQLFKDISDLFSTKNLQDVAKAERLVNEWSKREACTSCGAKPFNMTEHKDVEFLVNTEFAESNLKSRAWYSTAEEWGQNVDLASTSVRAQGQKRAAELAEKEKESTGSSSLILSVVDESRTTKKFCRNCHDVFLSQTNPIDEYSDVYYFVNCVFIDATDSRYTRLMGTNNTQTESVKYEDCLWCVRCIEDKLKQTK